MKTLLLALIGVAGSFAVIGLLAIGYVYGLNTFIFVLYASLLLAFMIS
jgi:hypothetical protein